EEEQLVLAQQERFQRLSTGQVKPGQTVSSPSPISSMDRPQQPLGAVAIRGLDPALVQRAGDAIQGRPSIQSGSESRPNGSGAGFGRAGTEFGGGALSGPNTGGPGRLPPRPVLSSLRNQFAITGGLGGQANQGNQGGFGSGLGGFGGGGLGG